MRTLMKRGSRLLTAATGAALVALLAGCASPGKTAAKAAASTTVKGAKKSAEMTLKGAKAAGKGAAGAVKKVVE